MEILEFDENSTLKELLARTGWLDKFKKIDYNSRDIK